MRTKYSLLNACGYALAVLSLGSLVSIMGFSGLARSQDAPEAGRYLADLHKAAGMECDGCHREKPPKEAVATATCAGCHKEITKSAETKGGQPNPHRAHMSYPDCKSCHHAHKPSENQCDNCHNFGYETP